MMTTAKRTAAKKVDSAKQGPKSMPAKGKSPEGGLTAEGRRFFKERDGSNLKPGVTGPADTPEKMKRKGSFLTRHFTNPRGPMVKNDEPTRLALSAHAWGEPVPKTEAAAKKLAAKGHKLLEQFHETKEDAPAKKVGRKKTSSKKTVAKKTIGKKATSKK